MRVNCVHGRKVLEIRRRIREKTRERRRSAAVNRGEPDATVGKSTVGVYEAHRSSAGERERWTVEFRVRRLPDPTSRSVSTNVSTPIRFKVFTAGTLRSQRRSRCHSAMEPVVIIPRPVDAAWTECRAGCSISETGEQTPVSQSVLTSWIRPALCPTPSTKRAMPVPIFPI
jgi:hypothetical protein